LDRASRTSSPAGRPADPGTGHPGSRAPAADELQLDLEAERPATASAAVDPWRDSTAAAPISDEDLRRLAAEVARAAEESEARTAEAVRATMAGAMAEIAAWLRTERAETEGKLAEAVRSAGAVVRLMEGVLDEAVEVSGRTAKEYRESAEAAQVSLNALVQRVEKALGTMASPVESRLKDAAALAQKLVDEAERLGSRVGWRPWIMAAGVSLGTILLLTLLRPGWTMSSAQRTALRVGEAVIHTYTTATPAERADMRRVNRWREPGRGDSTPPPPLPLPGRR
jgi:hypothetical protein